jgi:hypothetical protein
VRSKTIRYLTDRILHDDPAFIHLGPSTELHTIFTGVLTYVHILHISFCYNQTSTIVREAFHLRLFVFCSITEQRKGDTGYPGWRNVMRTKVMDGRAHHLALSLLYSYFTMSIDKMPMYNLTSSMSKNERGNHCRGQEPRQHQQGEGYHFGVIVDA